MSGALRFLAGLALAALATAAGTRLLPGFPSACDLFLVATVAAARHGRLERALVAGSLAGWAADALAGTPFGLFGFTDAAIGYLTALAARRLVVERPGSLVGLFAAAGFAQGIVLVLLGLFVVPEVVELPGPVAIVLRTATTALLGPAWIRFAAAAGARVRKLLKRPPAGLRPPSSLVS